MFLDRQSIIVSNLDGRKQSPEVKQLLERQETGSTGSGQVGVGCHGNTTVEANPGCLVGHFFVKLLFIKRMICGGFHTTLV